MSLSSQFDKRVRRDVSHYPSAISDATDFDSPDTVMKVMWFLSFQRCEKPSDAWKYLTFNSLVNISAFF